MQNTPVINRLDRIRVLESFADATHARMRRVARSLACGDTPAHIGRLLLRMQQARPINPTLVPCDMVTMNSVVRLIDLDTLQLHRVALVYDAECAHDIPAGTEAVEIQEELGSELLARCVGDTITLTCRSHTTRLRIDAIEYQPEALGDYDR
jgi:transcription elongation GreA/GreB family factor